MERLSLYDTTLRDGQQTQGVQFSVQEKQRIAALLDQLGVDYVEGGWPGANPTDSAFFDAAPRMRPTLAAFGMTKRPGRSAENDDTLAAVVNAGTPAVCLVGKTHPFHVRAALGQTLEENREGHPRLDRPSRGAGPRGALRRGALLRRPRSRSSLRARMPPRRARRRRPLGRALRHQRRDAARAGSGR